MINEDHIEKVLCNKFSCIRIAGVLLLPPLITTERRVELQHDKARAIEIENRLKFQKDLNQFFKQFKLQDFSPTLNSKSCDKILDDLLFDGEMSCVNALNIVSPTTGNCNGTNVPFENVPLLNENQNSFDLSEPNHRKVFDKGETDERDSSGILLASTVELDLTDAAAIEIATKLQTKDHFKYPLVRSKTFILPAPSPVLLKHWKDRPHTSPAIFKKKPKPKQLHSVNKSNCKTCLDFNTSKETSLTNVNKDINKNILYNSDCDCHLESGASIINSMDNTLTMKTEGKVTQAVSTNVAPINLICDNFNLDLPVNLQQYNLEDNIVDIENKLQCFNDSYNESETSIYFNSESLIFGNDPLNMSTPNLIDLESDQCDTEVVSGFEQNDQLPAFASASACAMLTLNSKSPLDSSNMNVPGDVSLYRFDAVKVQRKMKEQWAAGILTAATKGYLVRRLKRTDRVKNLIQTIRDALVCALSLHTESTESIQFSDVELHRRLIQQVSAACYEFYEIFFSLTTKEKMDIIAVDRQRIQDKLKRPKSGTTLMLPSNRSTPKLQRDFSAQQKRIMMPTFAV